MDEEGQSTLEFVLSLILLMGASLFFIQLCLFFAWGNYVHYATFMSARAYLSAGPSEDDQRERAKNVIVRTLKRSPSMPGMDRFPMIAKADGGGDMSIQGFKVDSPAEWGYSPNNRSTAWMEGVRYRFRSRIFMIPFGKVSTPKGGEGVNSVTLQSESWLGRDRDEESCLKEMARRSSQVIDNGC